MTGEDIGPSEEATATVSLNGQMCPSNSLLNNYVYPYRLICDQLWSEKLLSTVVSGD